MNDEDKISEVENLLDGKMDSLLIEITIKRPDGTKVVSYVADAFSPFQWNSTPMGMLVSRTRKLGLSGFQYYPVVEHLNKWIK